MKKNRKLTGNLAELLQMKKFCLLRIFKEHLNSGKNDLPVLDNLKKTLLTIVEQGKTDELIEHLIASQKNKLYTYGKDLYFEIQAFQEMHPTKEVQALSKRWSITENSDDINITQDKESHPSSPALDILAIVAESFEIQLSQLLSSQSNFFKPEGKVKLYNPPRPDLTCNETNFGDLGIICHNT